MVSGNAEKRDTGFLVPFVALLAAYCSWVLTLPLFPSLDGSLHLYYASVLGSLLSGSKAFASYYFIRHILPPYALHYYFLIAAAHFFGYVMADKLLVCLIFIATAFGFRYLARYLGPCGGLMSLFIIPLLLNWPLGMGFYNYCLAIGMALWALGFWYRAVQRRSHRLWLAFLTVVILMLLTHPVPLVLIYVLVGIDVFSRFVIALRSAGVGAANFWACFKRFRTDLLYMFLAWATIGYIFLFIDKHKVMANVLQTHDRKAELIKLAKLSTLAMFSGPNPSVLAYRLSLIAILLLALVLAGNAAIKQWANRAYAPAVAILASSLILAIAVPILPPVINGAHYFSQRLVIFVWIGTLASASAYSRLSRPKENMLASCILLYSIAVLALANYMIRPVACRIAELEAAPVVNTGLTGLTLSLPVAPVTVDLDYMPYYWVGARYFRRTRSTLLNGGWLDEHFLPLGSGVDQLDDQMTPNVQDSPGDAYQLLLHSARAREKILPHADVLLFTGQIQSQELLEIVKGLDRGEPSRTWVCTLQAWYSTCTSPFANSVQ